MRAAFCDAMVALSERNGIIFFTGDLGFMALEPLQQVLGPRFINAGIAEQNMVTVAAGAASTGEQCWAYSIAPFIYGRPFEQVRNDVCLHRANVKLVGNGGGYGYGVMGATHHAIEDYGVLLTLQNMRVYIPAFAADVGAAVTKMAAETGPGYLRLGRCEKPRGTEAPPYAAWRKLLDGERGVLIVTGACAGPVFRDALALGVNERPELWVVTELPLAVAPVPEACRQRIVETGCLYVLEEHVAQGGLGQMLAYDLALGGVMPARFRHFCAKGYPSGRYGSQAYHREECEIDSGQVLGAIQAA